MNKRLLINDLILIFIIIVLLGILSYFIYKPSDSDRVTVMYNNSLYGEYSISDSIFEEIADSGVIFQINNGKAFIYHSECPDKTCVNSKPITKNSSDGASVVCLPAKVAIIKNSSTNDNSEVDAVAG